MQGSAHPTFDPLAGLRAAAAAREAAGLRRYLVPRAALAAQRGCAECGVRVACFRPPSVPAGEACLRLTGRATLTEKDISVASRALAVARDRCHHCRNTAQAGRNTP